MGAPGRPTTCPVRFNRRGHMDQRVSLLLHSVAASSLLAACVTGPLQGDQITSTSTVSGYFPSTTETLGFQVEDFQTGAFTTCSAGTASTSSPFTDCAQGGGASWYPFSLPATLPSAFNNDRSCPAGGNGCCVNQPWEYYQPGSGGSNGIVGQVEDIFNTGLGPLATFSRNVPSPVDGTSIPLSQCVSMYQCAGDIINHCSQGAQGLPQTLQLTVPCGGTGQQCCLPLPTSFPPGTPLGNAACTDTGTSCDWDLICRYHLWPPSGPLGQQASASWYKQDWNEPENNMQHNWTDEFQGLASDGVFWYFSAGDMNAGVAPNIYRIGFNDPWDQDFHGPTFPGPYQAPGADGVHGICGHWGDIDTMPWSAPGNGATIFVPEEQCQDGLTRLMVVDDFQDGRSQPMAFVKEFQLNYGPHGRNQSAAPAVAINRQSQEIYTIGEIPASYVHVYRWDGTHLDWNRDLPLLDPNGKLMKLQDPNSGGTTAYVQGMAFSPEGGKLYIQTQSDLVHPLQGFQVNPSYLTLVHQFGMSFDGDSGFCPQETEGITVVDTDVPGGPQFGQIHGIVYEDHGFLCTGSGGVWAKHIRLLNDGRF